MAWYEELFAAEDPARLGAYAQSELSRGQVDFAIDALRIEPGARVLDLCCGQGRHLTELIKCGFDAVGVDLSSYMLEQCRLVAEAENIHPQLIQADMRKLPFVGEFDAVVNFFTSFGYLETQEEDRKVIDAVHRSLKIGGRFLVDLINRDECLSHYRSQVCCENERGDVTLSERHFEPRTGRLQAHEVTICTDGQRIDTRHSIRLYTCTEIEDMLRGLGFEIEAVYGDYDSSPLTMDSPRMIIVAVNLG